MPRPLTALITSIGFLLLPLALAYSADQAQRLPAASHPPYWYTDYAAAWKEARHEKKMLLVLFRNPRSRLADKVERFIATDQSVHGSLGNYVLARLSVQGKTTAGNRAIKLLKHGAFAEMHGLTGLAIVDLAHDKAAHYGYVVSAFPFMQSKYYRFRTTYIPVILGLPSGTITQRTMVWAVRVHPERPASTGGVENETLANAARNHSRRQARMGLQGHQRWGSRFQFLRRLLGGGAPVEVVAESWPGETMVDACIDCVASWRQSSGHWLQVKTYHGLYGYDIKRGSNGIWYGTGIFANYQSRR